MARVLSIEPLKEWPEAKTSDRQKSPFSAKWPATLDLLEAEIEHIKGANPTLQTMHSPEDVRVDGRLRSDTRNPREPGVILVVTVPCPRERLKCKDCREGKLRSLIEFKVHGKKYGHRTGPTTANVCQDPNPAPVQLRFPCDRFNHWKDNVRAIALALEALRKIERYGVKQGAQYEGFFKALPAMGESGAPRDFAAAVGLFGTVLGRNFDPDPRGWSLQQLESVWKEAARKAHPDQGGTHELMSNVNASMAAIRAHYNGSNK